MYREGTKPVAGGSPEPKNARLRTFGLMRYGWSHGRMDKYSDIRTDKGQLKLMIYEYVLTL